MAGLKTFSTNIVKPITTKIAKATSYQLDPVVRAQDAARKMGYQMGTTGGGLITQSNQNASGANSSGSTGGSSGGSGSSKKSSSSSTASTSGYGAMLDAAALYNAQMAQQQAAAEAAYNNSMARIAAAYGNISNNIQGNYDSSVGRLKSARDKSLREVNVDAEDSLRQAYINNELNKRNLNQRLSAMGYNGGATESTMANLANEYANSRTDINKVLNRNIKDLEQTYGDNLATALQAYNTAMNNLDMQRLQMENAAEQARANMVTSTPGFESLLTMDQNYLTALQNALAGQAGFTFTNTEATNEFNPASVQQAVSTADATNYAKALSQAEMWANQGDSAQNIVNKLYSQVGTGGLDLMTVAQIRQQLGI